MPVIAPVAPLTASTVSVRGGATTASDTSVFSPNSAMFTPLGPNYERPEHTYEVDKSTTIDNTSIRSLLTVTQRPRMHVHSGPHRCSLSAKPNATCTVRSVPVTVRFREQNANRRIAIEVRTKRDRSSKQKRQPTTDATPGRARSRC